MGLLKHRISFVKLYSCPLRRSPKATHTTRIDLAIDFSSILINRNKIYIRIAWFAFSRLSKLHNIFV